MPQNNVHYIKPVVLCVRACICPLANIEVSDDLYLLRERYRIRQLVTHWGIIQGSQFAEKQRNLTKNGSRKADTIDCEKDSL